MSHDPLLSRYDVNYISGIMSLRKPQKTSLKRLDEILDSMELSKEIDLEKALSEVHSLYPTCTAFERDFPSLAFALATGVGKTRLMGAFITYLYAQKGIKNFFVVAPGKTVYEKLKQDLGDPSASKYVFRGIGCFSDPPQIFTDDDYRQRQIRELKSDVRLFIFNIDKFNKEDVNMKHISEYLGKSFYDYLADLKDLVIIMDESHHYRAKSGMQAINALRPVLGLELTATPYVRSGAKQTPFKNVVYEYPLSKAIEDGYTRTPYAVTRSDIDFYNFGDEQLDQMMITDGIICHEAIRRRLELYARNHPQCSPVKPFMMIVCKDTAHAEEVRSFIQSDAFRGGNYRNKVIVVHSGQKGEEKEANIRLLLDVERYDNPVEIVIHVNMLKEGWDVNNLYTIVPLRTAASKIMREQMVGRGLRLPYGQRTGDKAVDGVMLTAHDKFHEIIEEAQKGNSIFKAGNVIKVEDVTEEEMAEAQLSFELDLDGELQRAYEKTKIARSEKTDRLIKDANSRIRRRVIDEVQKEAGKPIERSRLHQIVGSIKTELEEDKDLGQIYRENEMPLMAWMLEQTENIRNMVEKNFIPIPRIRVTDRGEEEYFFVDFDMDLRPFRHVPVENDLLIQNLEDMTDKERVHGGTIYFEGYNPKGVLVKLLREKAEIDYEKCSRLLFKLITQVYDHYVSQYGEEAAMNIVMMYKKDIADKIYQQMLNHFSCRNGFLEEEVIGIRNYNLKQYYGYEQKKNLYESFEGNIKSVLFTGIKRGVFSETKFDSEPELFFARVIESDPDVIRWLRPARQEFDITYNRGQRYVPDFVVETEKVIYLVEVKDEKRMEDADVIAKKERGLQYCKAASDWGSVNGYKEWRYLFIPSKEVKINSSFRNLSERFKKL